MQHNTIAALNNILACVDEMGGALRKDLHTEQLNTQPPRAEDRQPRVFTSAYETELRDLIETHKELITDRLDPDFGLLDELLASRSLTRPEVARVKAVSDSYGRSEKIMEYVSNKGIFDTFVGALINTQQNHLANFIFKNGERGPESGDDWPLTEREISILDDNQRVLVDLLETCSLLFDLYSDEVINNRQRDFVSSKTASHEKNSALLEILRRTSLRNYKRTIFCLHSTKQSHIANLLNDGGGLVRVRSELETESYVSEVEDELITKITELLADRSLGDLARILKYSQLRLIDAKKGNSIILYFFCKTLTELIQLQEMQISGKLESVIKELFNEMLLRTQVINLRTTLYDEDFSRCELGFRRVGAIGELNESCVEDDGSAASNTTALEQKWAPDTPKEAEERPREIKECQICFSLFIDPRMLPCNHTLCFECLKIFPEAEREKTGDEMPCPLCRIKFVIPRDGMTDVQKNVFMDRLWIAIVTMQTGKSCTKHIHKPLDFYCADCKKTVCDLCIFENHKLHDCKNVTKVHKEFRQTIEKKAIAMKKSTYTNEILFLKTNNEKRKADFFKEIDETEKEINYRNRKLKDMIDRHTRSLLDELSVIRSKILKEMESQMEEIERCRTVVTSFEAYCRKLALKGSASDICSSVDELLVTADELERGQEAFIGRLHKSFHVSFQATDLRDVSKNPDINYVGTVEEITAQYANFALIVGTADGKSITRDIVKINLNQPNKSTTEKEQFPTDIGSEVFAAVYKNTMYVTGIGRERNEVWKYKNSVGWECCTNMSILEGRRGQSAAFIDEVLYICGGHAPYNTKCVLDSVEAFNAVTSKCTTVGKLVHAVHSAGNCVSFKSSLYIFGGSDKDFKICNYVQAYNTKGNTCTLISKPMPRPYNLMRAVLWDTSAILFGCFTCFIFDIEKKTWQERKQFKTDVAHFGLVLENGRIFVIGGGAWEKDKDGKEQWKFRDDVRYVPLPNILDDEPIQWKIQGILPKPCLVHAYANVRQLCPLAT